MPKLAHFRGYQLAAVRRRRYSLECTSCGEYASHEQINLQGQTVRVTTLFSAAKGPRRFTHGECYRQDLRAKGIPTRQRRDRQGKKALKLARRNGRAA